MLNVSLIHFQLIFQISLCTVLSTLSLLDVSYTNLTLDRRLTGSLQVVQHSTPNLLLSEKTIVRAHVTFISDKKINRQLKITIGTQPLGKPVAFLL